MEFWESPGAPLSPEGLESLVHKVDNASDKNRFVQLFAPKLRSYLSDFSELVDGQGDGVVALKRGRLDDVKDTIVLPFDHWLVNTESHTIKRLHKELLARLRPS